MTELGPILTRAVEALERLAALRHGAMQSQMDAADPVPDVNEPRDLATKLRTAAQLPLSRASRALGQLTKEELERLELAERLVASPGFRFDPSEESARQVSSADLRSVREWVRAKKGKR